MEGALWSELSILEKLRCIAFALSLSFHVTWFRILDSILLMCSVFTMENFMLWNANSSLSSYQYDASYSKTNSSTELSFWPADPFSTMPNITSCFSGSSLSCYVKSLSNCFDMIFCFLSSTTALIVASTDAPCSIVSIQIVDERTSQLLCILFLWKSTIERFVSCGPSTWFCSFIILG